MQALSWGAQDVGALAAGAPSPATSGLQLAGAPSTTGHSMPSKIRIIQRWRAARGSQCPAPSTPAWPTLTTRGGVAGDSRTPVCTGPREGGQSLSASSNWRPHLCPQLGKPAGAGCWGLFTSPHVSSCHCAARLANPTPHRCWGLICDTETCLR